MDIRAAEKHINMGIQRKKKEWSGRGPKDVKVLIKGDVVEFTLLADFSAIELECFKFCDQNGFLDLWAKHLGDGPTKFDMNNVMKGLNPELEIVEMSCSFSGENYKLQRVVMKLNRNLNDL